MDETVKKIYKCAKLKPTERNITIIFLFMYYSPAGWWLFYNRYTRNSTISTCSTVISGCTSTLTDSYIKPLCTGSVF